MNNIHEQYQNLVKNWMDAYMSHNEEMHQLYTKMMNDLSDIRHNQIDAYVEKLENHLDTAKTNGKAGMSSLMLESAVEGAKRVKSHLEHTKKVPPYDAITLSD